jgi:hypothetical protein
MERKENENRIIATAGRSLLLIWWGVCFVVGLITLGMSAIGTGLIRLGANAVRLIRDIPRVGSTTVVGVVALVWGSLDTGSKPGFEASLAVLLVAIGVIMFVSILPRRQTVNKILTVKPAPAGLDRGTQRSQGHIRFSQHSSCLGDRDFCS